MFTSNAPVVFTIAGIVQIIILAVAAWAYATNRRLNSVLWLGTYTTAVLVGVWELIMWRALSLDPTYQGTGPNGWHFAVFVLASVAGFTLFLPSKAER